MKKALVLSGIYWNSSIQRHHVISKILVELGYEVYFIEAIPSSVFSLKKLLMRLKKLKKEKKEKKVDSNGVIIKNYSFLNPILLFKFYNIYKINKLRKEIGEEVDLVINYLPISTTLEIIKRIKFKKVIYDCVRDFEVWGGYPKNIMKLEDKVVKKSQFILVDSFYLNKKLISKYSNKKIVQILPTLDVKSYEILKKSSERKIEKIKRIVYFGSIADHLDIELLNNLSKKYEIHIIGEIYSTKILSNDIIIHEFQTNLIDLSNLIYSIADALIIPYLDRLDGVIPAKLMQCLATQLPIFINEFYDSLILQDYLYVYKNEENLCFQIENFEKLGYSQKKKKMKMLAKENLEENLKERIEVLV